MIRHFVIAFSLGILASPVIAENAGPGAAVGDEAAAALQELQCKWGSYAPKGWRVIMAATGHLFGARSDDVALIVEDQNPTNIIRNESLGASELNANPRILLLLTKQGESYVVKGRYEDFLPSEGDLDNTCLADPLMEGPGVEIKSRQLIIGLQYWHSCGSWYVNRNTFKFRPEEDRMRLIGMDSWGFHRGTGMGDTSSINYLTGRKKQVANVFGLGPEPELQKGEVRPKPVTKWTTAKRGPFYLDSMNRKQCGDYKRAPNWCGF
jgi:hypothetical protein